MKNNYDLKLFEEESPLTGEETQILGEIKKMKETNKKYKIETSITRSILVVAVIVALMLLIFDSFVGHLVQPNQPGYEKKYVSYIVSDGETITSIADTIAQYSHGVMRPQDVEFDMIVTNHKSDHIEPGDRLLVPWVSPVTDESME